MSQAGLMVNVMGMDATAGGVTSGVPHAVLVGEMFPEIFTARPDMPALEVEVDDPAQGIGLGYLAVMESVTRGRGMSSRSARIVRVRAKPAGKDPGMFGGHFVHTSDSRFPFSGPIPVFDRYESR